MNKKKHYISLTIKGGNYYHKSGETLNFTERLVNIGETADCDVRYEAGELQPDYFATIIQNEDGKSWRIVKRSQYIDIYIAGKGAIGYAHLLTDGDIILFGNCPMTLCFHTHYDGQYNKKDSKAKQKLWTFIAGSILLAVVFTSLFIQTKDAISEQEVLPLETSIYLVKVDSVKQVLMVHGLENYAKRSKVFVGDGPAGTAFLTTDGKLVTARHCVEYWISKNIDLTTKMENMSDDDVAKWAIEAETFNQHHPQDADSVWRLKVWFTFFNYLGEKKYSFASTDTRVHINTENDGLFLLADFRNEYFWRSIRPYFENRKMELGDILWIDGIEEEGKIALATTEEISAVQRGTELMICGYPMTGTGDKRMIAASGTIKSEPDIKSENLFFESNINHGFSGGPVLMKSKSSIVAIGVVSRVDSVSNGLFKWAVPVTEMENEKRRID